MKLLFSIAILFLACIVGGNALPVHISAEESHSDSANQLDVTTSCPPGYQQPANSGWTSCYKIATDFKSRNDAFIQCTYDNGALASVPNAFVNSYLYQLAKDVGITAIWLGIKCYSSDPASCMDDDHTNFTYNNFYPGQPTLVDICVYMSALGRDAQQWLSYNCDQTFQFACEVPAIIEVPPTTTAVPTTTTTVTTTTVPTTTTTVTTTVTTTAIPTTVTTKALSCPKHYKKHQGMCYAVIKSESSQSRKQQKDVCKSVKGGNLATISSSDINDYIGTLSQNVDCYYTEVRMGLTCPNVNSAGDTKSCKWDDGTKFKYNAFANGDPNEEDKGDCPYISEGVWYDNIDCDSGLYCAACQAPLQ